MAFKIVVFSDSHGEILDILRALDIHSDADAVIHLGDYVNDIEEVSYIVGQGMKTKFEYVAGNGDFFSGYDVTQKTLLLCQKSIFMTHGHYLGIRSYGLGGLYEKGRELKCDIFLFGHTHIPHIEERYGCLFLNPGSVSYPRSSAGKTYAVVEIGENGVVDAAIKRI